MLNQTESFVETQMHRIVAGEVEGLLEVYTPPLPIFYPGGVLMHEKSEDVRRFLLSLNSFFRENGISRIATRVLDVSVKKGTGTICCRLELRCVNSDEAILLEKNVTYYLEPATTDYKVVMLECDDTSIAEITMRNEVDEALPQGLN